MCGSRSRLLGLALLAACGRGSASSASSAAAPTADAPAPPAVVSVAPPAVAPDAAARTAWPALVRDEQWDAARKALDALGAADEARPEIRYVRARVALARGDAAAALPLLEDLEASLPLLASDVARRRAEAMLAVGPFAAAAAWFAARSGPTFQLEAARAYEKAGDAAHARAAVDRALASEKRTRAQEAEGRALRAGLPGAPVEAARADARWLATEGADLPAAAGALALVARLDPGRPLGARELMVRARVLADAGRTDEALRAIDLSATAPDAGSLTNLDRARARGNALFHARGRGSEAAEVLSECAAAGGLHAAEDAFHAARALSRVDRDEEAIRGYEDVQRRFPKSPWGVRAGFFVPYLRMLHGRWHECARGFDAYLRADGVSVPVPVSALAGQALAGQAGEDALDARRDRALCELLDGDAKDARATFERMVEDPPDPIDGAVAADLAALAALRDGDRTHAITRWTDVARSRPLSWPALVARARLAEIGASLPPLLEPTRDGGAPPPLVISLPPPADLLHAVGLDADAESALRERESIVTSSARARGVEALCDAYGILGTARRRYQIAQSLPSSLLAAAPAPSTRWAWECAFPSPYADEVRSAEAAERLPAGLLWAVMRQESGFDPDALSPARAVGLMQLLPETAASLAAPAELALPRDDARLTSPPYAIRIAARLLRELLDRFGGNVALAVAAYNGGAESVERWLARAPGMQLDTFVARIPFKETRDYMARVLGNLARYEYLDGGEPAVLRLGLALRASHPTP